MPQTLEGTLPGMPVNYGCKVVLEARDPTDGTEVSGVEVTDVNIYGLDLNPLAAQELVGPLLYVPGPTESVVAGG